MRRLRDSLILRDVLRGVRLLREAPSARRNIASFTSTTSSSSSDSDSSDSSDSDSSDSSSSSGLSDDDHGMDEERLVLANKIQAQLKELQAQMDVELTRMSYRNSVKESRKGDTKKGK